MKLRGFYPALALVALIYLVGAPYLILKLADFLYAPPEVRPGAIAVDLDGDGAKIVPFAKSEAYVDFDGDGFATKSGWIDPKDGILVIDRNDNGQIDDGVEFVHFEDFVTRPIEPLAKVRTLFSTGFSIGGEAELFARIKIWRDENSDGRFQDGEMLSPTEVDMERIYLPRSPANVNGKQRDRILYVASYETSQSRMLNVAYVRFSGSRRDSIATDPLKNWAYDSAALAEVESLPNLRGWGTVPNLKEAMLLDPELRRMVVALVNLGPEKSKSTYADAVEAILYRWTGTQDIAIDSRGPAFDGRKLAAIEKIRGRPWRGGDDSSSDPSNDGAEDLTWEWDDLIHTTHCNLLYQGPLIPVSPYSGLNLMKDEMELDSAGYATEILIRHAPKEPSGSFAYWDRHGCVLKDIDFRIDDDNSTLLDPVIEWLERVGGAYAGGKAAFWKAATPELIKLIDTFPEHQRGASLDAAIREYRFMDLPEELDMLHAARIALPFPKP